LQFEQAAVLAAETERALKELEPKVEKPHRLVLPEKGLPAESVEKLAEEWEARMAKLEAKVGPYGPCDMALEDVDELQSIAQEIVDYKERLRTECGYRKKDFKSDPTLYRLEGRLDDLAGALLGAYHGSHSPGSQKGLEPGSVGDSAAELRERAQRLAAKIVRSQEEADGLSPSASREREKLLLEVVELRANMAAEGVAEREQERDERVQSRLLRVGELRQKAHRDKKREQRRSRAVDRLHAELEQLRGSVATHKGRLRSELGYSSADMRQDMDVAELEGRLAVLDRIAGA